MRDWILANYKWLFSGAGLFIVTAVVKYGYRRWREGLQGRSPNETNQPAYTGIPAGPKPSKLPAFVRRLTLKPEEVSNRIRVGLREESGLVVSLGSEIPYVDLYFQITNLSTLDLVLDRLLVDVWFGQPTFQGAMLDRYPVPAGEITTGMHLRQMLADNQRRQVEARTADRSSIMIKIVAYFESDVGRLVVVKTVERRPDRG